jgi:hypothetical protein
MAIKWPLANGNWSNAANWNDGTLPLADDIVHADGKTVTIDQDVTVASIRNDQRSGGTVNGGFNFATTLTTYNITADLFALNVVLITFNQASKTYNLIGNIDHLASTSSGTGLLSNVSGVNINIVGNIIARGLGNNRICISVTASQVALVITGNITGGTSSGGLIVFGVNISGGSNIITITGNLTSQSVSAPSIVSQLPSALCVISTSNIITVYGNVLANATINSGAGILITGISNNIFIYGDVVGNLSYGSFNGALVLAANTNNVYINKIVGSDNGTGVAVQNLTNSNVIVKEFEISSIGTIPAVGKILIDNTTFTFKGVKENLETAILTDDNNVLNFIPTESNVRNNKIYYDGLKVGTMAVPVASNVRKDVPVDDTVGTADLTAEDILNAILTSENPVAERLRNVSTVQTTGDQIAGS